MQRKNHSPLKKKYSSKASILNERRWEKNAPTNNIFLEVKHSLKVNCTKNNPLG